MRQTVEIKNRTLAELTVAEGVIETLRRLKCDERLSFISPEYIIGKGTVVYCFVNVFGKGRIGENCIIASYTEIQGGVNVGDNCRIGSHCFLCSGVTLEDDVFLGSGVITINDKNPRPHNKEYKQEKTVIKKGASIGSGSVLMCGIEVGENAVVGAGSVVTKSIPAGQTWCGNPARPLKRRE